MYDQIIRPRDLSPQITLKGHDNAAQNPKIIIVVISPPNVGGFLSC